MTVQSAPIDLADGGPGVAWAFETPLRGRQCPPRRSPRANRERRASPVRRACWRTRAWVRCPARPL